MRIVILTLALVACGGETSGDGPSGAAPACVDEPGLAPCCDQAPLTAEDCPAGTTFAEGDGVDGSWSQGCNDPVSGAVRGVRFVNGVPVQRVEPDTLMMCNATNGRAMVVAHRDPLCVVACYNADGAEIARDDCDPNLIGPGALACQE